MNIGIKWGKVYEPTSPTSVVILGSGKSVSKIDLQTLCYSNLYIISVNDSIKSLKRANCWFTLDPWGLHTTQLPPKNIPVDKLYAAVPCDYGTPMARTPNHRTTPTNDKIIYLHRLQSHNYINESSQTAYKLGLSEDSSCINTGNSGYGALNLAYHLNPKKIYLLGIDGDIGYFYSNTKTNRALTYLPIMFESSLPQLNNKNIQVINVSPNSTITCFNKIHQDEFNNIIKNEYF